MAETEAFIKLRIGTAAQWTSADPILLAGEKGIESDTKKEKVGDGTTAWTSLTYQIGTPVPESALFTDTTYSVGDGGLTEIDFTTARKNKLDNALISGDIGDTVQAFDANTAKSDVAQTFSEAQRTGTTAGDNSIAFNSDNNHTLTATAANLSVTNQTIGQSGTIIITDAENLTGFTVEYDFGNAGVPTGLTGVEIFAYYISGASGADSIKIGRL